MPAGEAGDIVSNGNFLLDDILTNDVKLFDINSNLLLTLASWSTFGYVIRKNLASDSFYVTGIRATPAVDSILKNISSSGSIISTVSLIGLQF